MCSYWNAYVGFELSGLDISDEVRWRADLASHLQKAVCYVYYHAQRRIQVVEVVVVGNLMKETQEREEGEGKESE